MNPSASGWINKFESLIKKKQLLFNDKHELYHQLRSVGFIYGINVAIPDICQTDDELSEDEMAKINLLTALYFIYVFETRIVSFSEFTERILEFYKLLEADNVSFLDKIFGSGNKKSKLEKIINSRVQLDENIITKNFHKILTNSVLFIDVLTFRKYLTGDQEVISNAKRLENIIINLTIHALNSKQEKTVYDTQLLKLFESSLTYSSRIQKKIDGGYLSELKRSADPFEQTYFLDLACLAVWDDKTLEYKESEFIFGIGKDLKISANNIVSSLNHVEVFFKVHFEKVSIFKAENPVKDFYDNSTQLVKRLIIRNKKRLLKEFSESKELIVLLTKSTTTELTSAERKKIREQLFDIFKSIPSLAIFALPGGAVLLPLFVKLIPKLLPSAFDDNRVEED